MKRVLFAVLVLAVFGVGCAGKKLTTVISLEPVIAAELQAVQQAVEGQKIALQGIDCGGQNCYVAWQTDLAQAATYDKAFNDATAALNTASVVTALGNMSTLADGWITTRLVKLPANVQPVVLVALEAFKAGLAAAQTSLQ
jgi:hypothetical protein